MALWGGKCSQFTELYGFRPDYAITDPDPPSPCSGRPHGHASGNQAGDGSTLHDATSASIAFHSVSHTGVQTAHTPARAL